MIFRQCLQKVIFLPELNTIYNEFIKAKYGNDSALKRAYRDGYGTHSDESIAKRNDAP